MTEFPSSAATFLEITAAFSTEQGSLWLKISPPLSGGELRHKNQIIGLIKKMVALVDCGNTDLFVFVGAGVAGAGSLCCCLGQPGEGWRGNKTISETV